MTTQLQQNMYVQNYISVNYKDIYCIFVPYMNVFRFPIKVLVKYKRCPMDTLPEANRPLR